MAGGAERPEAPDPWLGRTIEGRYRIDARLGEGGMGAVYAATQLTVDRPVAVKVLRNQSGDEQQMVSRFLREARTCTRTPTWRVRKK